MREEMLAAVAPNAQLLIELVPELELIIGPQPAVPELPRTEAQNRFQIALLNFVRVIANKQPLVIFLDDLQFGDASTLNLIRWLATARDLKHLLVIGAYRSNEVDVGHPLRLALNEIRRAFDPRATAAAARSRCGRATRRRYAAHRPRTCAPLSALLHDRAEGNPFFLTEMLKTLEQRRAIAFAPD